MKVGIVIIGRNEGERLGRCLSSLGPKSDHVVYVDSGSTDGSVAMAKRMGATTIELDMSIPFTAARARNDGFTSLHALAPDIEYVQFVDGDCELVAGWLETATSFLNGHQDVAAACGRLREKHPDRSIYNMLCDIEWDTPTGNTSACGGIAMMRASSFESVNGFRPTLIAGEESELCIRLRAAGWKIWRLPDDMALHDAAMTQFGQWWVRISRGGYAFAEGAHLHGASTERHCVRQSQSIWFWALGIPTSMLLLSIWWRWWALTMLLIYPLQIIRLALRGKRTARENWWLAAFLMLGKFPELSGQIRFWINRYLGRKTRLIEYK